MNDDFPVGRVVLIGIGAVVLVIVLAIGGFFIEQWWTRTTAPIKGRTNQISSINGAENRTFQQEHFETLYGDIKGYVQQIHIQQQALNQSAPGPERDHALVILTGLRDQCVSTVQQYNADANKISADDFRTADVPYQIDQSDPTTDCMAA